MGSFSVGSEGKDGGYNVFGQSFTPNVSGPSGTGGPGTATTAVLANVILGYPTSSTVGRATLCFVYSVALDDSGDISSSSNLVAQSQGVADGSEFGTGSHTRNFNFSAGAVNVSQKYYAYFSAEQAVSAQDGAPYSGGGLIDEDMDESSNSCQFLVKMSTP